MKNTLKSLLAIVTLSAAASVSAIQIPDSGDVFVERTGIDGGLGGGIFEATIGADAFYTFCVERYQPITTPRTYQYSLSGAGDFTLDTISVGTAYLFKEFTIGHLAGFDGTSSSAGYLQAAIWILEGQGWSSVYGPANPFLAMVDGMFGVAGARADYADGEVKVMNLSYEGTAGYQDLLVYVPDSGATLMLLGFGLAGIVVARRRS